MDVAVSTLRAQLSEWLDRARNGEEIVVTERGVPVARLIGVNASATLERLTADGVIGKPAHPTRPKASGRRRVKATGSLAKRVTEQRR